jgi:hypothetical protein
MAEGQLLFFFFTLLLDEFALFKGFTKSERARYARTINAPKRYVVQILEHMKSLPKMAKHLTNFCCDGCLWAPSGSPNHALQRTRQSRSGCNPRVPQAGPLSLGR